MSVAKASINKVLTKTPIFILHGWAVDKNVLAGKSAELKEAQSQHPTNLQKWQPLVDKLKALGAEVFFLPLPGLSTPLEEVWGLNDYADWLHSQIEDKVGAKQSVILLGHSFGGQLALRFTSLYPAKVEKLILIAAAGLRDHSPKQVVKRLLFANLARWGRKLTQASWARNLLYFLAREKDYWQAPPLLRKTMQKVLADEVKDDLPKIKKPTLLLWGKQDRTTPLWMGQFLANKLPQAELLVLDSARHSPQFTHPDWVAREVVNFL